MNDNKHLAFFDCVCVCIQAWAHSIPCGFQGSDSGHQLDSWLLYLLSHLVGPYSCLY